MALTSPDVRHDLAVIIVTHNSARDIGALLDTLRADADDLIVAVLVADNSSADDTMAVARAHAPGALVYATGGNIGYSAAINTALARLDGAQPVMILNPDSTVSPGTLRLLLDGLRDGVGAVVPRIVGDDGTTSLSLRREPSLAAALGDALLGARLRSRPGRFAETVFDPARYESGHEAEWATGAALLLSPAAIAAVGLWDERFFLYSEETDYFRRIRDAGFRVLYEPAAVVHHAEGGSGASPRLDALMAVNRVRYIRKHRGRPYAALYRALVAAGELLRLGIPGHALALRSVTRESSWTDLPGPVHGGEADDAASADAAPGSRNGAGAVVYLPGVAWDDIAGTDRRLVEALARQRRVVWIDPAISVLRRRGGRRHGSRRRGMAHRAGVVRVRTFGPPALTRPIVRNVTRILVAVQVRRALRRLSIDPGFVVLAAPNRRFPAGLPGRRVLYVTDDWIGGAALMGLSRGATETTLRENARDADLVLAVSPVLAAVVASQTGVPRVEVLANGAEPVKHLSESAAAGSPAILIAQLNERLDIQILESLADAGIPLTVVGPRADRDPAFARRLDAVVGSPNVDWLGPRPYADLAGLMTTASVGITPYADSAFNRASFPLKTLEYLGAGLPVVTSDIPAARWLGPDHVDIVDSPAAFVARVAERIAEGRTPAGDQARHEFAQTHSWDARASLLQMLVARCTGSDMPDYGGDPQ